MLRKVVCACVLSLLSVGCAHGTWVVRPEGRAKVRDWKYETFMPWMVPVMGPMVSPGALAWVHIVTMRACEDGIVLDTDNRQFRVISAENGKQIGRWSPPLSLWRSGHYSGPQPYGDALYSLIRGGVVELPAGAREPRLAWPIVDDISDEPPQIHRKGLDLVGCWLVVAALYPGECRLAGIDLRSRQIAWRSTLPTPEVVNPYPGLRPVGRSAVTSYWRISDPKAQGDWRYWYLAVDVATGEVLDVYEPSADVEEWYGNNGSLGYAAQLDPEANTVTVLRGRKLVHRRHDSGEVVWEGEFSSALRCFAPFASHEARLYVEFDTGYTLLEGGQVRYALRTGTKEKAVLVETPGDWEDRPLRGVAAVEASTGRLLWCHVLTETELGLPLRPEDFLKGPDYDLANRAGPFAPIVKADLVIMRPLTFTEGQYRSTWHYLVGLDGRSGEPVFIYGTHRMFDWYGEEIITGFLAQGSVVCFSTYNGRVYGLDLSDVVGREETVDATE